VLGLSFSLLFACADAQRGPDAPVGEEAENEVAEPGSGEPCDVPSDPDALLAYLRRGDYKEFEHESAVHGSGGPHGGRVFTYVNEVLAESLTRGNATHPRCAAAIKELYALAAAIAPLQ
jgi:hypothetical protein